MRDIEIDYICGEQAMKLKDIAEYLFIDYDDLLLCFRVFLDDDYIFEGFDEVDLYVTKDGFEVFMSELEKVYTMFD